MRDGAGSRCSIHPRPRSGWRGVRGLLWALLCSSMGAFGAEADYGEALGQFLKGKYEDVISTAKSALRESPDDEQWQALYVRGLLTVGRYPEAYSAMTNALEQVPRSVVLRWLARDVYSSAGRPELATAVTAEIPRMVSQRPWSYRDPDDLIVVGRALLTAGVDPKNVLDRIFAAARKADPDSREVYLASGELALDKNDFALAARHFDEGLKRFPEDPDLLYGRARAFAESDRKEMGNAIEQALEANARHVPSLLLLADHQIDAEDYDSASKTLGEAQKVNPAHPESWAYAAVIAHLRNDREGEQKARETALKFWSTNPRVPYLIGKKLSQKYRFAEGSQYQREALSFEPDFLPSQSQLANDLLRLGDDGAGWDLIQEVHRRDGYDVNAFNLVTLHDTMGSFSTLTNEHFILRMSAREAGIYGQRALDLLERARATLVAKYDIALTNPTVVEIFPEPKDFGVRTFGMPDNPGYLGVCFGRVITANSPASSRSHPVNWESVLWHEFCHVITLQMTANKMPRWLSEGISVFEERAANPAWGEQMNPKYREMILGSDLTPVSKLSAAFLMPKSGLLLQFAYYESSLVVEFLVERFGLSKVRAILLDLREGTYIDDAIERHTMPMEKIEKEFAAFARKKAEALGPGLNWEEPARRRARGGDPARAADAPVVESGATNYWRLLERTGALVKSRRWSDAVAPLEDLIRHYPEQTGSDSAYALLARAHRELGNSAAEKGVLERWSRVDAEATDAYLRLMEMSSTAGDWGTVVTNVDRYLAVNPLVPAPYRYLARAREGQGAADEAIQSYQMLLRLDPPNPAEVHYRLAILLEPSERNQARRHLLESLEDAPRNREALRLLLKMRGTEPRGDAPGPDANGGTP